MTNQLCRFASVESNPRERVTEAELATGTVASLSVVEFTRKEFI